MASIFYTFHWTAEMNYARLAFAWVLFAVTLTLIIVTALKLRKTGFSDKKQAKTHLFVSWLVVVGIQILSMIWPLMPLHRYLLENVLSLGMIFTLISIVFEWAKIIAFTVALTNTARFLYQRKTFKTNG